ncbi:hypothetical protein GCM10010174_14430 [Kutzneria viridogrisea]|uniref:DUF3558 domain-containing protein n=1 Tax=Kutzneria viridogrisea TaxID=47990 RepID=A0ABR6BH43_9PSEU|nr:hypothetical protein [Kutzneria viridogrisea]
MLRLVSCAVLAAVALTACTPGADQARSVSPRTAVQATATGVAINKGPTDPAFAADRLRAVDPCGLLDKKTQALVGTPGEAAGNPFTGCQVSMKDGSGQAMQLSLDLGSPISEVKKDATTELAGTRVLETRQGSGCMDKAITQDTPGLGLVLRVDAKGGTDPCEVARKLVTAVLGRLRTAPPAMNNPKGTLAVVDPCALVDKATVDSLVGTSATAQPQQLHECLWRQPGVLLYVTFRMSGDPSMPVLEHKTTPVDLGGLTAYQLPNISTLAGCSVSWWPRATAAASETVVIRYDAEGDSCAKAVAAAKVVAGKLPRS